VGRRKNAAGIQRSASAYSMTTALFLKGV